MSRLAMSTGRFRPLGVRVGIKIWRSVGVGCGFGLRWHLVVREAPPPGLLLGVSVLLISFRRCAGRHSSTVSAGDVVIRDGSFKVGGVSGPLSSLERSLERLPHIGKPWFGVIRLRCSAGGFSLLGSLFSQLVGARLVPAVDLFVCPGGKDGLGKVGREVLSGFRVLQMPVLDGVLKERDMLLRTKQDLQRLPSREASRCERRDGRPGEVVRGGLKGVLAAGDLPDVGDRFVGHIDEEGYGGLAMRASYKLSAWTLRTIIVTANSFVKGGQFLRRQLTDVLVANVANL